jgi:hypothetical protein
MAVMVIGKRRDAGCAALPFNEMNNKKVANGSMS